MPLYEDSLDLFTQKLASNAPYPGGGGAAAATGALAVALCSMVGNLTVGKKKYADVEDEALELNQKAQELRETLLRLIDADAECFEPLSKAYSIPKDDPSREAVMERALAGACTAPLQIMRSIGHVVELLDKMAHIGSRMAISDVAAGATLAKAGLQGACLNIYINTNSMKDRGAALRIEAEADRLLNVYSAMADSVYATIITELRR